MRLGIGSYTYTWAMGVPGQQQPQKPLGVEGVFRAAGELGVSVVQLCDNVPLAQMSGESLSRIAASARAGSLSLEIGVRGTAPAHLRRHLRIASELGARLVRTVVTSTIDEARKDIAETLKEFEKANVVLALENYEKYGVRALAGMIQSFASTALGACLDTVNSLGALEPPREVIAALMPCTANLHIKDFEVVRADHMMGFLVQGAPAGKGRLDVPGLLEAASRNGRDPTVILELWTPPAETIEATVEREKNWARESILFLRRYITS